MEKTIIEGEVVSGRRLGGRLGFPTANIAVGDSTDIRDGVYAARVRVGECVYQGMANLGYRPSVESEASPRMLEVNLFGFEGSLYGLRIAVELVAFVRPEERFGSLDDLKAAVDRDRSTIEEYFKNH